MSGDLGRCGRYVLLHELAAGGMGVVYAAYDPELDRKVALKLLRPERGGDEARSRLLREAQAMARLSHPNVIAVHDVGVADERVFVAMELVSGQTLRQWLKQRRPWQEVLAVLGQAGAGLAAAHRAGLVHRDFKPGNVMLGDDGRVRVLDFGLARAANAKAADATSVDVAIAASEPSPAAGPPGSRTPLETPLTQDGAFLGTPAYMTPEQLAAQSFDARSDQFAFCTVLFEALHGVHPFGHGSFAELIRRIRSGDVEQPAESSVPAWLQAIVLRGLATEPAARFASMDDLLAELDLHRRSRRRGVRLAASVAVAVAAVVAVAVLVGWWRDRATRCQGAERRLEGVWDDARRADVEAAFRASARPYAADAWQGLRQALDRYAADWTAMHTQACEATRVYGEQSEDLLARRMLCLDRRLAELGGLSRQFAAADEELVKQAVSAAQGLSDVDACADLQALLTPPGLPREPAARERLQAAQRRLGEAHARQIAGRYGEGLEIAEQALADVAELGYRPLEAELRVELGLLHMLAGHPAESERSGEQALQLALAARHDTAAAEAATLLAQVVGAEQLRFDAGRSWSGVAQALIERTHRQGTDLERRLLNAMGIALWREGRYDDSLEIHRRNQVLTAQLYGADHPMMATTINSIAVVLQDLGRHEEALAEHRRALEIRRRTLGEDHPQVGVSWNNLGNSLRNLGRLEEALEAQRNAHRIFVGALGPSHRYIAYALQNQANVLDDLERDSEAVAIFEQAESMMIELDGPESADLGGLLVSKGSVLEDLGRYEESALALRRALAIDEKALGGEHPFVAHDRIYLALVLLDLGQAGEALTLGERALGVFEKTASDPSLLPLTRLTVARALVQLGRNLPRARSLARDARRERAALGEQVTQEIAIDMSALDDWLRQNGL